MFDKEIDMSNNFQFFLEENFKNSYIDWVFELEGITGIPDCVIFEKTKKNIRFVVTLEFKLKNWKRALEQSKLSKLYSNLSFVVISSAGLTPALKNINSFIREEVGLATFTKQGLEILYCPTAKAPISDIYTYLLYMKLIELNKVSKSKNKLMLWKHSNSLILEKKLRKFKKVE